MAVVSALFAWSHVLAQSPWENDDPIWEYEDESPIIPIQVLLDIHDIKQAWTVAIKAHDKRFKPEFNRREGQNPAFASEWTYSFAPYWVGFNDYLYRYVASKLQVEARMVVPGKIVDLSHSQLRGRTLMVTKALVEKARDLTHLLENDIVIEKWEIFVERLETLEETIKELD